MNFFKSQVWLKDYKPFIVTTASVVLLGYFNLADFYSYFRLNIYPYLDAPEILLLSLSDMMGVTFIWLVVILVVRSLGLRVSGPEISRLLNRYQVATEGIIAESKNVIQQVNAVNGNRDVKNIKKYESLYREAMESLHQFREERKRSLNLLYWSALGLVALGALVFVVALVFVLKYFSGDVKTASTYTTFQFDYMSLACLMALHAIGFGILVLLSTPKRFLFKKYPYGVVSICFILLFLDVRNGLRYRYVMAGKPKYTCTLTIQDSTHLKSDSTSHVYIGATRNFRFFYNKITAEQTIVPVSKVVTMKMIKNHEGL